MVSVCTCGRGAGQLQAVAGEVGKLLDVAVLIIVGENGRVFLSLELRDFADKIEHGRIPCF